MIGSVKGFRRRCGALLAAAAMAALVAACGSSASSTERTHLTHKLTTQLRTAGVPSDLASCVTQQSRGLPLASVRELARGGAAPSGASKQGRQLFATCVTQGKGVSWLRAKLTQSVQQGNQLGISPAFTTCVDQKMNAIQPSELASLLFPASATQADAEARGKRFGIRLADQCLAEPALRPVLLGLFLAPTERGLKAAHYSAAFKRCLIGKLRNIPSSELVKMAADPSAARSIGTQFGRNAAEACIASGAKP